jgi:hypothetical protein
MTFLEWLRSPDQTGISQQLQRLFSSVTDAFVRFFESLFQAEINVLDNAQRLHDNFLALKNNIPVQIKRVHDFKFDPHWKSRVINVPIAINQMKRLVEEVSTGWRDRLATFEDPLHEFVLIFKAEKSAAGDPNQQVSAVSKAAVKIDEIATLLAQLAKASDTLIEIDRMFDDVLKFFQSLDQVFLQQGNSRKWLTEKRVRIRVGKLHG